MWTVKRLPPRRLLLPLLLLIPLYWALRFAWADYLFHTGDAANIRKAAAIVPFHPVYQARAGNLTRAVELNPYYSSAWMELGLEAEQSGDIQLAEKHLLQAAAVDRQFAPRWALANFYFRQNRWQDFDNWLRLAAERSYGDRTALFRLAARSESRTPPLELLPADREVLGAYVAFLLTEQRWREAAEAGLKWLPLTPPGDRDVWLDACERILQGRASTDAMELWNAGVARFGLGYPLLSTVQPLTNAELRSEPLGKSFDWRLLWRQGVRNAWRPGEIRIGLDGRQFEKTDLVEQILPCAPGRYKLQWRAQAEGITSSIRWRLTTGNARDIAVAEHDVARQPGGSLAFEVPQGEAWVKLTLWYERKVGTVRQEGTLRLTGPLSVSRELE